MSKKANPELTNKLIACIEYMIEHRTESYSKVAEAIGVHVNSVHKWRKQEKFQKALDSELHRVFREAGKIALDRLINIAETGRDADALAASKFILENGGFKEADKVEIGTSNTIKINIE